MHILCLSNGHGEDMIGASILQSWQQQNLDLQAVALPLVGEGVVYQQSHIPIIGSVKNMPSGGFINMDSKELLKDVGSGLFSLTLQQLTAIKSWSKQGGKILAVGDIVPLLMAWWSGVDYAFVGTAKSEYYLRDEAGWLPSKNWWSYGLERMTQCIYFPWERWLMSRTRCRGIFPRDRLTSLTLQRFKIPAVDLGNPMMDGLHPSINYEINESARLTVLLLPGSRAPEVYRNWEQLLAALDRVMLEYWRVDLQILAAIAANLDCQPFVQSLLTKGWQLQTTHINLSDAAIHLTKGPVQFSISQRDFADYLHRAHVAIAMAGTATEQFAGLGKPVISIPGQGPQFTRAFAEAQTRLLGSSVTLITNPTQAGTTLKTILDDPDRLYLISQNGRNRLGKPGAAHRIAHYLETIWGTR